MVFVHKNNRILKNNLKIYIILFCSQISTITSSNNFQLSRSDSKLDFYYAGCHYYCEYTV